MQREPGNTQLQSLLQELATFYFKLFLFYFFIYFILFFILLLLLKSLSEAQADLEPSSPQPYITDCATMPCSFVCWDKSAYMVQAGLELCPHTSASQVLDQILFKVKNKCILFTRADKDCHVFFFTLLKGHLYLASNHSNRSWTSEGRSQPKAPTAPRRAHLHLESCKRKTRTPKGKHWPRSHSDFTNAPCGSSGPLQEKLRILKIVNKKRQQAEHTFSTTSQRTCRSSSSCFIN